MTNEYVSLLNGLIEICKDGEKGFREAAEDINIGYYQILFQEYARQRSQFASVLQQEVRKLGGDPDRKGSMAGTIHRGWMNLRSSVNQKTNELIIRECERGE
ncbi:MAG TPA: PA2169 family four-helix-bundle protein, partial [Acidobacteriota bacterium]